jgi:hypothetical protein
MLILYVNILHCEVVEKPRTAEGWMLLFHSRVELHFVFRCSLSQKPQGYLKELPCLRWRLTACFQASRSTFCLCFLSRKINRKEGRCL